MDTGDVGGGIGQLSDGMALIDRIGYDAGTTRLEDALASAANHGFHYLNFNADIGPNRLGLWANDRARSIRQSCADNDIHFTLHTASSVNIAEFSPRVSEAVDQYLTANMELAQALACDGVVVHGGFHFSSALDARMSASRERLQRAVEIAERLGVTLLLENLNYEPEDAEVHYLAHTVEECRYYFDAIDSANFGWAFTVNHANLVPEGADGFLDAFGIDRIGEVRLADNLGDKEVHLVPGQGNIDFERMFRRLESAGYDKYYTMAFGSMEEKLAARDLFAGYRL